MPKPIELTFGPFQGGLVNDRELHLLKTDEAQVATRVDVTSGAIKSSRPKSSAVSSGSNIQWFGKSGENYVTKNTRHYHVADAGNIYVVPATGGDLTAYVGGLAADAAVGIAVPNRTIAAITDPAYEGTPNFVAAMSRKFLPKLAITKVSSASSWDRESNPKIFETSTVEGIRKQLTAYFPGEISGTPGWTSDTPIDVNWYAVADFSSTTLSSLPYDMENILTINKWAVKVGTVGTGTIKVEWRASPEDEWQLFSSASVPSGANIVTLTGLAKISTTGSQASFCGRVTISSNTFVGQKFKGPIYLPLPGRIVLDASYYRVWRWSGTVFEHISGPPASSAEAGALYYDGSKDGTSSAINQVPDSPYDAYTIDTNETLTWNLGGYPDLGDDTNRTIETMYQEDHSPPPQMTLLANALHSAVTIGRPGGGILFGVEWGKPKRLRWCMAGNVNYFPSKYYVDLADDVKAIITNAGSALIFTPSLTYVISGVSDAQPNLNQVPIGHHIRADAGRSAVWTPFGTVYLAKEGLAITDGRDSRVFSAGIISKSYGDGLSVMDAAFYKDRYELVCTDRVVTADFRNGLEKVRFSEDKPPSAAYTAGFLLGTFWVSDVNSIYEWNPNSSDKQIWTWRTGRLSNGKLLVANRMRVVSDGTISVKWVNDSGTTTGFSKTITVTAQTESYFWLPPSCRGRYPALEISVPDGTQSANVGSLYSLTLYGEVYDTDVGAAS